MVLIKTLVANETNSFQVLYIACVKYLPTFLTLASVLLYKVKY